MLNSIPSPAILADAFRTLDLADVSAGIEWYAEAYGIAEVLGIRYGVSTAQAAGVIAALSPQQGWSQNVKSAERFLADNSVSVHTRVNMAKCQRIIAGEDILAVLNADKTQNFYRGIISRGADGVCIDRHAIDIAVGVRHTERSRPALGKRLYRDAAQAYRDAAQALADEGCIISPAELQAVLWAAHVERWSGVKMSEPVPLVW
jgi:hypothetical protein